MSFDIKTQLTNIINKLCSPLKWRFTGSVARSRIKNYDSIKDIDLYISIKEDSTWNDVMTLVNNSYKIPNMKFTHVAFIDDSFNINIQSKDDFSNVDFKKINEIIEEFRKNDIITEEQYESLMLRIKKSTLEDLLIIEDFIKQKLKIKLNDDDIKNNKIRGKTIDLNTYYKDFMNKSNTQTVVHCLYFVENTAILIDAGLSFKPKLDMYVKTAYGTKKKFYKSMFFYYYTHNYDDLFKNLKKVAINFKLYNTSDEISQVLKNDFGIHRTILHKLRKLTEFIKNKNKYSNIDTDQCLNVLKNMIPLIKSIGFTYLDGDNDSIDYWVNLHHKFNIWFNNKVIPYYNQWRSIMVKIRPEINNAIPPEITKML